MSLQVNFPTKKALKAHVGQTLEYVETVASWFPPEYKATGSMIVCNERRSYFAVVTMQDNLITSVT